MLLKLMIFLIISTTAFAQNQQPNTVVNNIYTGNGYWQTGNVGINTFLPVGIGSINPGDSLDVVGTARVTGLTAGAAGITLGGVTNTTWPSGGAWTITDGVNTVAGTTNLTVSGGTVGGSTPNATLTITGGSSQWTGTSPGPIYYNTGNVGIGSISPGVSLDVQGTARLLGIALPGGAQGQIIMQNGVGIGTWSTYSSGSGSQTPWTQNINGAGYQLQSAGNIGIGTTNVQLGLVVMGNVGIGTWIPIPNGAAPAPNINIVGTMMIGSKMETLGNAADLQVGQGTNTATIDDSGNIVAGSYVQGTDFRISGANPDQLRFSSGLSEGIRDDSDAAGGNLIVKTNSIDRMWIMNGGNIGIGSSNPGTTLDVQGSLRINGSTSNFIGPNAGNVNDGVVVCGNSTTAGSAVPTGTTPSFTYQTAGKIVSATISGSLSAGTCSCTIDVWKTNAALPTVSNTITASALPTLSSATYNQNTTLSGWTTTIAKNDVIMCNVQSCTCDNWNLVLGVND